MFRRKCGRCGEKISRHFQFCPFCGKPVRQKSRNNEDYGLLGRDDALIGEDDSLSGIQGGGNTIFDKILGNAVKMLEREIRNLDTEPKKTGERTAKSPLANFQLYVNGKRISLPEIDSQIQNAPVRVVQKRTKMPAPSEKTIRESAGLPRKEMQTRLKRLANKIFYEIDAPGATSLDKVLINKVEGGVEVKIFTKDAVLFKNLAVKLPLIAYYLERQKLFLEFQGK